MAPKIGEGEARFWDLLVKVIASGIAIGTVVVGCRTLQRQGDQLKIQQKQLAVQQSQFETTSKEQAKALEEEYHRRFWEKKLEVLYPIVSCNGDTGANGAQVRRVPAGAASAYDDLQRGIATFGIPRCHDRAWELP